MTNDELMELAIQEALSAKNAGEVPVGAITVSYTHLTMPTILLV